jgi:hypothetical protein
MRLSRDLQKSTVFMSPCKSLISNSFVEKGKSLWSSRVWLRDKGIRKSSEKFELPLDDRISAAMMDVRKHRERLCWIGELSVPFRGNPWMGTRSRRA